PSYVENKHLSATGLMRGVVERQGKKFALIQALPHQDLVANEYILYEIDKNGDFKFVKHLSDLETDKNDSIYAYKGGFLLADNALLSLFYYKDLNTGPEPLSLPRTNRDNFTAAGFFAENNVLTV